MEVIDGPFIVQNIPGTRCIMISKNKEYEQDLGSFGMQFERLVTGRKMEDCSDYVRVEHLHTMTVGRFSVLFCAEVDAIDGTGSIVEVKASNRRYWNTKVMFQMISSGSSKLCHGEKCKQILTKLLLRNLESVANEALISADVKRLEENILNGMDSIRTQVSDDFTYKICFGRNGLELEREDSIVLFPPRQVTKRLLNGYKEIQGLMLPLTPEDEDILSKITDVNYRNCLDGKWLSTQVIDDYLQRYLLKRDLNLCTNQAGRKGSHFFDVDFMNKSQSGKNFDHNNYCRFSRRVKGGDIFNLKYLFFPINIYNRHWACIVVYMEEKRIRYCDSLGAGRVSSRSSSLDDHATHKQREQKQKYMMNWVFCYLKAEYKKKKSQDLPEETNWILETCIHPIDAPQQDNTNDCGVFVCMFCEFFLNDCALSFSQEMIYQGQWRKKIILRILSLNDLLSTKTSDHSGDNSDHVEIVEPRTLSKKSSRTTRFRDSMHEEASYSCEQNFAMLTECPLSCLGSARKQCKNNQLQKFRFNYRKDKHPLIKVARSENKGKGVFAKKPIKMGTFIAEYVGKRLKPDDPKAKNGNYVMKIEELYLDAEGEDSYAGTINHGCDPNCRVIRWMVDKETRAKVVAFKDVEIGDELTFDYKWNRGNMTCNCNARVCRGTL